MFRHNVICLGSAEQRHEGRPVNDAVARRSPAIVHLGAQRSGVLGLYGDNSIRISREFSGGVGARSRDPAAVDLEQDVWSGCLEEVIDGPRTVGQGKVFKIVIVPGDLEPMRRCYFGTPG